jgi:hypothetical protein
MLLFGILARPPLMVAGLFTGLVIMAGVGKFVGASFLIYFAAAGAGHTTGPVTWIAQSFMLCIAMVIFSHKIFGLITHLPDKVICWIGGRADSLGTAADESRMRGVVMASGGPGGAMGKAMGKDGGSKPDSGSTENLSTDTQQN